MMVTRGVTFRVRIRFLCVFVFEYAILSAFSLITDDGKINYDVTSTHHTKKEIGTSPAVNETVSPGSNSNMSKFDVASRSSRDEVTINGSTYFPDATFRNFNDSRLSNQTDGSKMTVNVYNLSENKIFEPQKLPLDRQLIVFSNRTQDNKRNILHNKTHLNTSINDAVDSSENFKDKMKLPLPELDSEKLKDRETALKIKAFHPFSPVNKSRFNFNIDSSKESDKLVPITITQSSKRSDDNFSLNNVSEQRISTEPNNITELSHEKPSKIISPIAKVLRTVNVQSNDDSRPVSLESKYEKNLTDLASIKSSKVLNLKLENNFISSNSKTDSDIHPIKDQPEDRFKLFDLQPKFNLKLSGSDPKNVIKFSEPHFRNDTELAGLKPRSQVEDPSFLEKRDNNSIELESAGTLNVTSSGNSTLDKITNRTKLVGQQIDSETDSMTLKLNVSPNFENETFSNVSRRRGKEFISEETLMESRNYNYDPAYPSYAQPVNPSGSGEEAYHPFATITRESGWYQDPTYPTLTTAKTPRAPQFPVPPHRWRLPLWYRGRLRGYPKDEPFYDYLEDEELQRWSQPTAPASSVSPIRPEFHRYHEGGGGYDYSPSYDFAHVHEHGGHTETTSKFDFSKIGLLLLLKLAIAKLKALGALQILLLLLLKAKLLLAMMALKFFMVLKAMKLLKYLIAPLLFSSLLPLLMMIPMSLLSALLPLLMNLNQMQPDDPDPVEDLPDPPDNEEPDEMGGDTPESGTRRKRRKHHRSRALGEIQRLLRSEDCLQRMACELAAKKQLAIVPFIVAWSLKKLANMLPIPIVKEYAKAYTNGRQMNRSSSGCSSKYRCNYLKKRS